MRPVLRTSLLAALALLATVVLIGCGSSGPEVGACSSADLSLGVDLFPEIVDCGDSKATSKLVSKTTAKGDCKVARLQIDKEYFCVEPIDKQGNIVDTSPKVGDCTTGDPKASVSFVKPVDCSAPDAKSKISKKVANESECADTEISTELAGNKYCLESL